MRLVEWWCRDCGAEILVDSSKMKFGDVRPSKYIEKVYCDVCEGFFRKQLGIEPPTIFIEIK